MAQPLSGAALSLDRFVVGLPLTAAIQHRGGPVHTLRARGVLRLRRAASQLGGLREPLYSFPWTPIARKRTVSCTEGPDMTQTNPPSPSIEVMWRPGCPSCRSLRRGLRRAGVETLEHDIWSSASAAARVRKATGGDETVPTVFVGDRALINPSVPQVVRAIRAVVHHYEPVPTASTDRSWGIAMRRKLSPGLISTLVVAVVWSMLVAWRPTTSWHLAPLILASAWPWAVGQDTSSGDRGGRRRIMLAGGGGLIVALALTGVLSAAGGLGGPTWTGSADPALEALLLSVAGAATATTVGLVRTPRQ